MLDRIEPSVDRLITHVEAHSDYERPEVPVPVLPEEHEVEAGAEGEGGHG
jgi:hypothetical protein